jgi:hypothetical protein
MAAAGNLCEDSFSAGEHAESGVPLRRQERAAGVYNIEWAVERRCAVREEIAWANDNQKQNVLQFISLVAHLIPARRLYIEDGPCWHFRAKHRPSAGK